MSFYTLFLLAFMKYYFHRLDIVDEPVITYQIGVIISVHMWRKLLIYTAYQRFEITVETKFTSGD